MAFQLQEVTDTAEFDEIVEAHREAFRGRPAEMIWRLLFPEFDDSEESKAAAHADAVQRTIHLHQSDPYSRWVKAIDPASGRVIGAARWFICTQNPFDGAKDSPVNAAWWPEGPKREFANRCGEQLMRPRHDLMQLPHAYLEICFTHAVYRRRGIGRMLTDWGTERADQLNLPAYIDATLDGKGVYEKCGFQVVAEHTIDMPRNESDPEWVEMEKALLPCQWWGMLRPAKSDRE